jgi:predicted anti-sigma-YlaC factor YlaD
MKISCNIIRDLLPLYHDGVCSQDSRALIEEHLLDCANCRDELREIGEDLLIGNEARNLAESEAIKNLSRTWRKGMLRSLLKGILIAIIAICVIAAVLYVFMDIRVS